MKENETGKKEKAGTFKGAKDTKYDEKADTPQGSKDESPGPSQANDNTKNSTFKANGHQDNDAEQDSKMQLPDPDDEMELILHHVGVGRYQILLFVLMMPFGYFFAYIYFVQMFIAAIPQNHWCNVPELAQLDMETRRNLSAPGAATGNWDKCNTFDVNWAQVLQTKTPPPPGTPTIPCKHGWEFELTDIPYPTVVSERGWVCDQSGNVPMAQMIFFLGSVLGCLLFGWIADRYGRVPALVGTNLISGIGGIATIYTSGMWDFSFCRFLVGMGYDNVFMMIYILVLEYVGPSQRTCVANLSIALFFGTGCMTLPWLAFFIKDWRILLWVTSLPMLLVVLVPFIIPESARWYMSVGRIDDAEQVLRKFERINRTKIPDNVMSEFIATGKQSEPSKDSLIDILRNPVLRTILILMLIVYMACALIYDGLVRLCDVFGLDFFVSFTMASATEVPSALMLTVLLDRLGRRNLTAGSLISAGLLIIMAMFVRIGITQALMATFARFFINMSFNASVQWATELLPTSVRASGSAALHMSGNVISMLSPYIVYSERVWHYLPLLILCIVALISSALSTMMPETKGLPMPQTMADGERLINENRAWSLELYRKAQYILRSAVAEIRKKPAQLASGSPKT